VRTLLVREPRDLAADQQFSTAGPRRKGEEPKPTMHGREKSDSAILATKPTNKAGRPAAEPVERRAGTNGNVEQQSTRRAQQRESVSQALSRVRQAADRLAVRPKIGAECPNRARSDLCGGRAVMRVPTAIFWRRTLLQGWSPMSDTTAGFQLL
jgi:hypothetical protein